MSYQIKNKLKAHGIPDAVDWLMVGLGNPGTKYKQTRHNIGFMALDFISEEAHLKWLDLGKVCNASVSYTVLGGQRCLLCKPQTYMNLSGEAVAPLLEAFELPPNKLMVLVDDVNLPFGKLRFRPKGSAGGQNGLKSIIASLKQNNEFPRLRLGLGLPAGQMPLEAYVLQVFSAEEKEQLPAILKTAHQGLLIALERGVEEAQQAFNGLSL
jgi:peptidyl-tRNA hydrolase, PTH1 family